jgi:hypothetical protein
MCTCFKDIIISQGTYRQPNIIFVLLSVTFLPPIYTTVGGPATQAPSPTIRPTDALFFLCTYFDMYMSYRSLVRVTLARSRTSCNTDVTPGALTATRVM